MPSGEGLRKKAGRFSSSMIVVVVVVVVSDGVVGPPLGRVGGARMST